MTVIIAFPSDLQVNSTAGLCAPEVVLDDGGTYRANEVQLHLWGWWNDSWDQIEGLKKELAAELYVVFVGEVVDGPEHHRCAQLVSRNPADMLKMAGKVIERPVALADRLVFLRATEAHSGPSGLWDELLGEKHGGERSPTGSCSWFRWRGRVEDVLIDAAHAPGASSRLPWTEGNAANKVAARVLYEYARRHQEPPQVVVRAHNHRFEESGDQQPVKAVITPPWQLNTAYGYNVGMSEIPQVGTWAMVVRGGKWFQRQFFYEPKMDEPWQAT